MNKLSFTILWYFYNFNYLFNSPQSSEIQNDMLPNTSSFSFLSAGAIFPVCFGNNTVLVRLLQPCDNALKYKCTAICESFMVTNFLQEKDVTVLL